jgi:hypothetical protein
MKCKYCGDPANTEVVSKLRGRYFTCGRHKPQQGANAEHGVPPSSYRAIGPAGRFLRRVAGM